MCKKHHQTAVSESSVAVPSLSLSCCWWLCLSPCKRCSLKTDAVGFNLRRSQLLIWPIRVEKDKESKRRVNLRLGEVLLTGCCVVALWSHWLMCKSVQADTVNTAPADRVQWLSGWQIFTDNRAKADRDE